MIRYGFELEGFAFNNGLTIPNSHWPLDDFPGLVELRSSGGSSIEDAYSQLFREYMRLDLNNTTGLIVDFGIHEAKFTGRQIDEMRRTRDFNKRFLDVRNLYGKASRSLNGKTLASFQINISNQIRSPYTSKDGVEHPAQYGLLDVHRIVYNLDVEFKEEIRKSNRQPGMYALKGGDIRLEYRSLPNSVASFDPKQASWLLTRIKKAVEQ